MAKRKRRKSRKPGQRPPAYQARPAPPDLIAGIEEVERLTGRRQWAKALEKLREINRDYPNQPVVLTELVNVCYELNDTRSYQYYVEQLNKIKPDDPDTMVALAGAYLSNMYPALALQAFRRFVARYPGDERVDQIRQTMADLEEGLQEFRQKLEPKHPDPDEALARHEEVRARTEQGRFKEARQIAHQLLRRDPDFVPVLNNLSLVEMMDGQPEQALKHIQRVLALEPANFQALGNLVRGYVMQGQFEAARLEAEKLKQIEDDESPDLWAKKVEAFTYVGDDRAVLETLEAAGKAGCLEPPLVQPVLYHFAAVAAVRLGDEKQGRQYWQKVLELEPNFELARANLADMKQPAGERHAPWPFELRQWISEGAIADMIDRWQTAIRRNTDQAMTRAARRYLKQHPHLTPLLPTLFERGDPLGRDFAFDLVRLAETDELLALLPDFALSQHGPDELRYKALQMAKEAGLIPAGPVQMWFRGERQEIMLHNFEIHDQPTRQHSPEVEALGGEAAEALYGRDGAKAERLLKQALELAPNSPDLMNNLAMAYTLQGRQQETETLLRQIHRDHPDYFFGRVGMANLYIQEGDLDRAEEMLTPLLSRQQMHVTEFTALAGAYIQLFLAKDLPEAAQHWLDMWAGMDPDDPQLKRWQKQARLYRRSEKSGWLKSLGFFD